MKDSSRTNTELIKEISALRKRIKELEQSESEHKQAGEALRESENKYRTLVETTGTGFVIIDKDGLVLDANPEYVRLTGHHDLSEIVGRSVIEWTADAEKGKNAAAIKAALEKGYVRNLEIDYVDSKGSITPIVINATSVEIEGKIQTITICRDITERRRAEKALHESEQRYRAVFENTGTATVIIEADTTISLCNSEFERLSGYTRNEIEGKKSWTEFVAREDLDCMIARHRIRRENHDRALQKYEFRFVPLNGERRDIYLVIDTIPGTEQSVGSLMDITERKQAEETLVKEREFSQIALNSQVDTFFVFEPITGRAVRWNKSFRDITGYTDEEIASLKAPDSYYSPEDLEKAASCTESVMCDGKGVIELSLLCKDGREISTEYISSLIPSQKGATNYIISIGRDITSRKKAEEELKQHRDHLEELVRERTAELTRINEELQQNIIERRQTEEKLRESEERYRTAIEHSNDGVSIIRGTKRLFVNRRYAEIFGYEKLEELIGASLSTTVHPDDFRKVRMIAAMRQKGESAPDKHEYRGIRKNGEIVFIETSSAKIMYQGKPATLAYVRDITKRREIMDELQKSKDDLEIKSKTLEELNTALRVLLHQREEDKKSLEDRVASNVKKLVIPYIEKIKRNKLDPQQRSHLSILETNLNEIVSPFLHTIRQLNLTPRETQVASLVKDGRTTKEIAEITGAAVSAIDSYRNSIRSKLGLNNKKVNLQSYLQSLI